MVGSSLLAAFQTDSYFIGSVSAFAVRSSTRASPMAATEPLAEAVGRNNLKTRQKTSPVFERCRPSPAKRRKINGEAGYWATPKTSNRDIAKTSPPLERPKVAGTYLDSESDELDSGEETECYRIRSVMNNCAQYMVLNISVATTPTNYPFLLELQ